MIPRLLVAATVASILVTAEPQRIDTERLFTLLAERNTVDTDDAVIAAELSSVALTTRLTAEPFLILSRQAGPQTRHALETLSAASANLPEPVQPVASINPIPDAARTKDLIDRISAYVSAYTRALPNFLCVESTRYFTSASSHSVAWNLDQKITEDVRYSDGAEEYTTRLVNDRPDSSPLADLRASYSRGEFGSTLSQVFDPASQARFEWSHWESIKRKPLAVLHFYITRAHSLYVVCCISAGHVTVNGVRRQQLKKWASAYEGFIYADPDTGVVQRFTYRNVEIPAGYNLDDARNLLDYEPVTLGQKVTWLPHRAIHYNRLGAIRRRNEIDFSNFRTFGADSTLQFPADDK